MFLNKFLAISSPPSTSQIEWERYMDHTKPSVVKLPKLPNKSQVGTAYLDLVNFAKENMPRLQPLRDENGAETGEIPVVFIRSRQDIEGLLTEHQMIADGHPPKNKDGLLSRILKNGGIIVADLDSLNPSDAMSFNSLLDGSRIYKETRLGDTAQVRFIGLTSSRIEDQFDQDFQRRIQTKGIETLKISTEATTIVPKKLEEINSQSLLGAINLYGSGDWKKLLIEAPTLGENGWTLEGGALKKAILDNQKELTIRNFPTDTASMNELMETLKKGYIWVHHTDQSGKYTKQRLDIPEDFKIVLVNGYTTDEINGIRERVTISKGYPSEGSQMRCINALTFEVLLKELSVSGDDFKIKRDSDFTDQPLFISSVLSDKQWDQLFFKLKGKIEVLIAPGIPIPKKYDCLLNGDQSTPPPKKKLNLSQLSDGNQSGVIVSTHPTFTAEYVLKQVPNAILFTEHAYMSKKDMLGIIDVKKSPELSSSDIIKGQAILSGLLETLSNPDQKQTVIIVGIGQDHPLFKWLEPIFYPPYQMRFNGQDYKITGKLILISKQNPKETGPLKGNIAQVDHPVTTPDLFRGKEPETEPIYKIFHDHLNQLRQSKKRDELKDMMSGYEFIKTINDLVIKLKSSDPKSSVVDNRLKELIPDALRYSAVYSELNCKLKIELAKIMHKSGPSDQLTGARLYKLRIIVEQSIKTGSLDIWALGNCFSAEILRKISEIANNNDSLKTAIVYLCKHLFLTIEFKAQDIDFGHESEFKWLASKIDSTDPSKVQMTALNQLAKDILAKPIIEKKEGAEYLEKKRKQLDQFLQSDGNGSLVLYGDPGVGKSFLIEKAIQEVVGLNCFGPFTINPTTSLSDLKGFEEFLEKGGVLWIDEPNTNPKLIEALKGLHATPPFIEYNGKIVSLKANKYKLIMSMNQTQWNTRQNSALISQYSQKMVIKPLSDLDIKQNYLSTLIHKIQGEDTKIDNMISMVLDLFNKLKPMAELSIRHIQAVLSDVIFGYSIEESLNRHFLGTIPRHLKSLATTYLKTRYGLEIPVLPKAVTYTAALQADAITSLLANRDAYLQDPSNYKEIPRRQALLCEGPPGIGKTFNTIAVLESLNYSEVGLNPDALPVVGDFKNQYVVLQTTHPDKAYKILKFAAEQGIVVVVEESNQSSVIQGYLMAFLTGKDPIDSTKSIDTSKLIVIMNQNPSTMLGRLNTDRALRSRCMELQLEDLTDAEKTTTKGANPKPSAQPLVLGEANITSLRPFIFGNQLPSTVILPPPEFTPSTDFTAERVSTIWTLYSPMLSIPHDERLEAVEQYRVALEIQKQIPNFPLPTRSDMSNPIINQIINQIINWSTTIRFDLQRQEMAKDLYDNYVKDRVDTRPSYPAASSPNPRVNDRVTTRPSHPAASSPNPRIPTAIQSHQLSEDLVPAFREKSGDFFGQISNKAVSFIPESYREGYAPEESKLDVASISTDTPQNTDRFQYTVTLEYFANAINNIGYLVAGPYDLVTDISVTPKKGKLLKVPLQKDKNNQWTVTLPQGFKGTDSYTISYTVSTPTTSHESTKAVNDRFQQKLTLPTIQKDVLIKKEIEKIPGVTELITTFKSITKPSSSHLEKFLKDLFQIYQDQFLYKSASNPKFRKEYNNLQGSNLMKFLQLKAGNCELFSSLTVFILQKLLHIPSRLVGGYVVEGGNIRSIAHGIVEVYDATQEVWIRRDMTIPSMSSDGPQASPSPSREINSYRPIKFNLRKALVTSFSHKDFPYLYEISSTTESGQSPIGDYDVEQDAYIGTVETHKYTKKAIVIPKDLYFSGSTALSLLHAGFKVFYGDSPTYTPLALFPADGYSPTYTPLSLFPPRGVQVCTKEELPEGYYQLDSIDSLKQVHPNSITTQKSSTPPPSGIPPELITVPKSSYWKLLISSNSSNIHLSITSASVAIKLFQNQSFLKWLSDHKSLITTLSISEPPSPKKKRTAAKPVQFTLPDLPALTNLSVTGCLGTLSCQKWPTTLESVSLPGIQIEGEEKEKFQAIIDWNEIIKTLKTHSSLETLTIPKTNRAQIDLLLSKTKDHTPTIGTLTIDADGLSSQDIIDLLTKMTPETLILNNATIDDTLENYLASQAKENPEFLITCNPPIQNPKLISFWQRQTILGLFDLGLFDTAPAQPIEKYEVVANSLSPEEQVFFFKYLEMCIRRNIPLNISKIDLQGCQLDKIDTEILFIIAESMKSDFTWTHRCYAKAFWRYKIQLHLDT